MKKHYLLFTSLVAISLTLSWEKAGHIVIQKNAMNHIFSSGAQPGNTGAPGEGNCTACHSGTVQDGTPENLFIFANGFIPVSNYSPGQTYNLELTMASSPVKKGFQATVLDASNNAVGTLNANTIGGTAASSGSGRFYVGNTTASSIGTTPWLWTWTAPSVDAGPIRFYIATNKSNSNGQNTGDVIYTSVHPIGSTAGVDEVNLVMVSDFSASFSPSNSMVYLTYSSLISGGTSVNIVDLHGRSAYSAQLDASNIGLNKEMIRIPSNVKNGMYVVHFFVNNVANSKSISIQR
jgi:hypothetical protein